MAGRDYGVVSPSTWRLADLSTKHAFLKDCVGWGGMPLHMVDKDIAAGTLVILDADDMPRTGFMLTMSAYHRPAEPPGPAGRWLIDHLKTSWQQKPNPAHASQIGFSQAVALDQPDVAVAGRARARR